MNLCDRTCATPEFLKGLERPVIFNEEEADDAEWKLLYQAARTLIGTSEHEFDQSIRHNVVLDALREAFPDRGVKPLPLACHRLAEGSPYVNWHSPDNVTLPYSPTFNHVLTNTCIRSTGICSSIPRRRTPTASNVATSNCSRTRVALGSCLSLLVLSKLDSCTWYLICFLASSTLRRTERSRIFLKAA